MNRPSLHVTVAAVVTDAQGRYLLVEEHTPDGLKLNNPAGHLEIGESPLDATARECLEETGRVFAADAFLGVYLTRRRRPPGEPADADGADLTYVRLAFSGTVGEPLPGQRLDEGIVRTLWLAPEAIEAAGARLRSPLVWRCIADHRAGRRLPLEAVVVDPSVLFAGDGRPPLA